MLATSTPISGEEYFTCTVKASLYASAAHYLSGPLLIAYLTHAPAQLRKSNEAVRKTTSIASSPQNQLQAWQPSSTPTWVTLVQQLTYEQSKLGHFDCLYMNF